MRLSDEWSARRFRFLLNIIDHLPSSSRYAESLAQDDELAAELAKADKPQNPGRPLSEWTPIVRELRTIAERVGILGQFMSHGQWTPEPLERFEQTALQRLRIEIGWQTHRRISLQLFPEEASSGLSG